jgi:hypothetical protein
MKRIIVNITSVVGFVLISIMIALPFMAELKIEEGAAFEQGYRWGNADKAYGEAIKIDPFNAENIKKYGDFLVDTAFPLKDKTGRVEKAKGMYEKALRLNPGDAELWYLVGKAKIEIYRNRLKYIEMGGNDWKEEINYFKKAVENDPNGFNTNYVVGVSLLKNWNNIDEHNKQFALSRLKHAGKVKPWRHVKYIYPSIMHYVNDFDIILDITPETLSGYNTLYQYIRNNNLWQYRKEVQKGIDFYRQKEEPGEFERERREKADRIGEIKEMYRNLDSSSATPPQNDTGGGHGDGEILLGLEIASPSARNDEEGGAAVLARNDRVVERAQWQGIADNGKSEYKDGNMYWTGTVNAGLYLPKGKVTLKIKAKGSSANDVWPYMIVELDGEVIGETFVDSSEWKEYSFDVDTDGGIKVLSVTFANDGGDWKKGIDRNLYVGDVFIVRK